MSIYSTRLHLRLTCLFSFMLIFVGISSVANSGRTLAEKSSPAATACGDTPFSDVCPDSWYYPFVAELSGMDAISGYSDGTFRPNNTVTRGQMIKIIVLATGLTSDPPESPDFTDVPETHPFYTWIETGYTKGISSGYDCGAPNEPCPGYYFRPSADVSRAQLAKMLALALGWSTLNPGNPTFKDVPQSNPFYGFVERAVAYGAISGYSCGGRNEPCPGRYFRPNDTSTRAQACKMVSIALANNPTHTVTPTGTRPTSTPTRSRTPRTTHTSQPAGTPPSLGSCPKFPANNIWNRNVSTLPTHTMSNAYINSIGLGAAMHADFGSGLWDGGPIGIPFITVPGNQPRVPVSFYYANESDPGPYPVPTNAPIEGGPNAGGDRHVIVVDRDNCVLYELYDAHPNSDGSWDAGSGARWQLTSNTLRPDTWTSADAAGLPILPGLVTYDEMASGVIRHAIRFTAPSTQRNYIWPARHQASSNTDPNLPPMGLRVRLKANVNISGYPTQLRVVLQALKDYGMILSDNGSPWYIIGSPDERWNNDILHQIANIHGSDFEAVDESGLMVDRNSGESR